jgi:GWxTD domain-containing protein
MRATRLLILLFFAAVVGKAAPIEATGRIAVQPFHYPANPDYGVFLADRLTAELFRHSYFEALDSLRFELVEPDTLSDDIITRALRGKLTSQELEMVRGRVDAGHVVVGSITDVGHLAIEAAVIDVQTGESIWRGSTIDNPAWTWTQAASNVGDIPVEALLKAMGYGDFDTPPKPVAADDLPRKIALQPIHTTSDGPLAADSRRRLQSGLERDGLFEVVKGSLGSQPSRTAPPRLDYQWRTMAHSGLEVDAVLCGSLMTLGKDGTVLNLGVASRLVEVPSGRILWAGASSGRRVWRHDKLTDVTDATVAVLAERFAQFGASAAETSLSEVLADAADGAGWARVGHAYLQRGLLKQAREAFNTSLEYPDARDEAYNGLGLVSIRRFEGFDQGIRFFRQAQAENKNNLEVIANLAQAHFDRDLTTGTHYAEEAIEKDPTFPRPYRILANWYEKNEEDKKAVEYYRTYLRMEPDDVEVAIRFGQALGRLQDFRGIESYIEPLLSSHPEAYALLPIVAYKDYRTGRFSRSRERFARFLGRIGKGEREIYEDITVLLSEAYLMAYEELDEDQQQIFVDRFWLKRDPDLTTEANERHLEHLSRVWIARRDYSDLAYPWDRRGIVYVRYGEPDYRARSGWVPSLLPPDVERIKTQMYQELYKDPPNGELVGPVFPIRSDQGLAARDLEEAIVENPGGRNRPSETREAEAFSNLDRAGLNVLGAFDPGGEGYAPVTLQRDNSIVRWESWTYVRVGNGVVFDFTQEAGGSAGFDFAPLPSFAPIALKSSIRLVEYAPEIAFERAVSASPDVYNPPTYPELVGFEADVIDLRGEAGETRLDVSYAVPASSVAVRNTPEGRGRVLTRSVALADTGFSQVIRQERTVVFSEAEQGDLPLVDVVPSQLAPGMYVMTLTVRAAGSGRTGSVTREIEVEDYSGDSLKVSDLLLATEVRDYAGGIRYRRGGLEVIPNPSRTYGEKERLKFYYEIYNLKKDQFGVTRYKVTTAIVAAESGLRGVGAFRRARSQEAAATIEQVGTESTQRSYLEVDLEEVKAGVNRLVLLVEDVNGGGSDTKVAVFQVQSK